ncbi:MAG TPA: AAA family ATPase, partial [Candidatus Nitrosocosmicus sp.]|nr:AAA family ATPase [Candidatus Nitrosocosmicus sp.]
MKIRKLQLKNIGVFDNETIEFQPCPANDKAEIHILTGQNGSGKSTILMALANLFALEVTEKNIAQKDKRFIEENRWFEAKFNLEKNSFEKRLRKNILEIADNEFSNTQVSYLVNYKNNLESYDFNFSIAPLVNFVFVNTLDINSATNEAILSYPTRLDEHPNYHLDFAVFAYSGYRQVEDERVEAIKEPNNFNPLLHALDFVKDYSQDNEISINQLLANNISKSAIEKGRNKEKSEKFANVIKSIERAISEITGWKIEFDLETEPTNLVTKVNGQELDFDVLPDGLRSLISWIADLAGRVDLLKWQDDLPIFEKNLILFLDEIEVHLHPAWQRKVLPVVQKLFKNSQIFVSTHSPFVVNSVDDAWVYKLELENGKAKVGEVIKSEDAWSYSHVLSEIFDIKEEFGIEVQKDLAAFK